MTTLQHLPEDWSVALAVAAHPDDLEYGSASAIARWTQQGKTVCYLLVTRGEAGIDAISPDVAGPLREAEERNSARVVGVNTVEFLDYQDGTIEYGLPLRRDLAKAIRRHRPEVLVAITQRLTFPGNYLNMADHRAVALALLDAARDAGNRWIFPELLEEGLEPWKGVRMVCLSGSASPTHGVDVARHLDRGVASLAEHRVYLENLGRDFNGREFLSSMAAEAGQRLGCRFAVSFEVIWV